jgi:transposase
MTWPEAAATYNVSESSVARFVKQHREEKEREEKIELGEDVEPPKKKQKCGRKSKLSPDILVWILQLMDEEPVLSTEEVRAAITEEWGITVAASTLDKELDKLAMTWKKCMKIPESWNSEDVILQRQTYVQVKLTSVMNRPHIFLDESPFNMHVKRRKGRSVKGTAPRLSLLPKGSNVTLLAIMSSDGIIAHTTISCVGKKKKGVTANDLSLFLTRHGHSLPKNSVLILDNAKIHHAKSLRPLYEMLEKSYGISILFLPPYSPFLNPIEYAFSKIKEEVGKGEWTTNEGLVNAIEVAVSHISKEDARGYIEHVKKYLPQASLGLPFTGKPLDPVLLDAPAPQPTSTVSTPSLLPPQPLLAIEDGV